MRTLKTLAALPAFTLVAAVAVAATSRAVDNVLENIPDPVFRAYCESQTAWDTDGNGKLSPAEAAAVTEINVDGSDDINGGIKSLNGIEHFTGLTTLYCDFNQLTTLDVSKNIALTKLYCGLNQLTTLDVSKNIALTGLGCNYNNLTTLDVSKNTALAGLDCFENQLTALDVSGCTALTRLYCYGNNLTTLDVSKNTALTELYCGNNQLTALDVSKNTALTELFCGANQLSALDVSNNTALTGLWCDDNPGDGAGKFPVKVWPSFDMPPYSFTTLGWYYDGKTVVPVYSEKTSAPENEMN